MNLPREISNFLLWWFVKTPVRLRSFNKLLAIILIPLWFIIPLYILLWHGIWFLLYVLVLFILWKFKNRNKAERKVAQVGEEKITKSFKPRVKDYLKNWSREKFVVEKDIHSLLMRLEVVGTSFENNFGHGFEFDGELVEKKAFEYSKLFKNHYVELEHLFLAILASIKNYNALLKRFSLDLKDCEETVRWIIARRDYASNLSTWQVKKVSPIWRSDQKIDVLKDAAFDLEDKFSVEISYLAIKQVMAITENKDEGAALSILERAVARVSKSTSYITAEEIAKTVSGKTKVPVTTINQKKSEKFLNIEQDMNKIVIGQEQALKHITEILRKDTKHSFLLVGAKGVGKTETIDAIAKLYFGDENAIEKIDMIDYEEHATAKMLKDELAKVITKNPKLVIYLSKLEKANSNVLVSILEILDSGKLINSKGAEIDFSKSVVVATSNVGGEVIQNATDSGNSFDEIKRFAMNEVTKKFAPEFLMRFSGIIVYKPLTIDTFRKIVLSQLETVTEVAKKKGFNVIYKEKLVSELVKRGFTEKQGTVEVSNIVDNYIKPYVEKLSVKQGKTVDVGLESIK